MLSYLAILVLSAFISVAHAEKRRRLAMGKEQ